MHTLKNQMLSVQDLRKSYGSITAVDGISFEAAAGETVGLLGPNGAGKTTTVSIVSGLLRPDSGQVRVGGVAIESDTSPVKQKIGLAPQDLALYEEMPALANLRLFAALYGISGGAATKAIDSVLTLTGLRDRAKDRVQDFSGGMKRRLNLAAALLHDPQVLLLDEPTTGVDPQSRNAIFDNLEALKAAGKTIVYTTHYMEEAERLCDRIVIVDHGRVIADDTVKGLYRRLPASNKLLIDTIDPMPPDRLTPIRALAGVVSAEVSAHRVSVWLQDLTTATPAVLGWFAANAIRYDQVANESPNLESVFLTLTGRSLRDA